MINIDFLVSGCNTRCRHCYVNGGPGAMMSVEDALLCIEKLDVFASHIPDDVTFTLDHEPMNHPHLDQILYAASHTRHIQNYHHGMTSGVGLMGRKDKEAVIRSYLNCGYDDFGITLHGSAYHHDEIVRRSGAYDAAVAAAEFIKTQGAKINVSLMLNRFFAEDAETISAILDRLRPDYIYFAMPIFTPHRNMMDFEPYRASLETVETISGYLAEWQQDTDKIIHAASQSTISAALEILRRGITLPELFAQEQDELYLTLHQDRKLYVGNSGVETRCLGDLQIMDPKAAAEIIRSLPGNRDYGAFYDVGALPLTDDLINALKGLPQDTVYGDFPSIIYRGLTALNIPTKIMS